MEKIIKYKYIIIGIFLVLLFSLGTVLNKEKKEEPIEIKEIKENIEEEKINDEYVYVDIKGYVNNPNVYKLSSNSRVIDVIEASGGLKNNADTSIINLSMKVFDEMVIIVYSKDKIESIKNGIKNPTIVEIIKEVEKECICPDINNDACINDGNNDEEVNSKININSASKEVLMTLSGIGESKAEAIIEYRENTLFTKIEDIKNITGIGESIFEKIKDYITV